MPHTFLIFGYGIPKDILKDETYSRYLVPVFNHIYTTVTEQHITDPLIITCGGKTEMKKPYTRSEAGEMIRFFKHLITTHPHLKPITKHWKWLAEGTSLSTLENILNSKKMLDKRGLTQTHITIYCETTRAKRVQTVAKKVFGRGQPIRVVPIDFDLSEHRYLGAEYIHKKETRETRHSLWALKSPENLKKHHELFQKKFDYLRKRGTKAHAKAVKEWWDTALRDIQKTSE
jgi:hypothetical protein